MQKIIRHASTLDRQVFRISVDDVLATLKELQEEYEGKSFTTCDIARALQATNLYRGISFDRIERSVRAGVSWLCEREVAYVSGEKPKTTDAGCISRPFTYALHPGRVWNNKTHATERNYGAFDVLNRAFLR